MTLKFIASNSYPAFLALSTDMDTSASTIAGASLIGKTVYMTDNGNWYIIDSDLVLVPFYFPTSGS
jgi:hypothetical protein